MKLSPFNLITGKGASFPVIEESFRTTSPATIDTQAENVKLVEQFIDYAWQRAIKYRYDPTIGRIHEEYLQMAKDLKNQLEGNT